MRSRRIGHVVVATIALVPVVLLQTLVCQAGAGDLENRKRPVMIQASPAILPAGTACVVALRVEKNGQLETKMVYEGTVVSATDEGMTLTVRKQEQRNESKVKYLSDIPLVGRLFRNIGIGLATPDAGKDVWIPSEKIELITLSGP
jgi:hypothetical protein